MFINLSLVTNPQGFTARAWRRATANPEAAAHLTVDLTAHVCFFSVTHVVDRNDSYDSYD